MSLRAARNDSAGRHWPAGRTLRTNALDTKFNLLPLILYSTGILSFMLVFQLSKQLINFWITPASLSLILNHGWSEMSSKLFIIQEGLHAEWPPGIYDLVKALDFSYFIFHR